MVMLRLIAGLCLLLVGCATSPNFKAYPGPDQPLTEVAFVRGADEDDEFRRRWVALVAIDGQREIGDWKGGTPNLVHVLPGRHRFRVEYKQQTRAMMSPLIDLITLAQDASAAANHPETVIEFPVQARGTYTIHFHDDHDVFAVSPSSDGEILRPSGDAVSCTSPPKASSHLWCARHPGSWVADHGLSQTSIVAPDAPAARYPVALYIRPPEDDRLENANQPIAGTTWESCEKQTAVGVLSMNMVRSELQTQAIASGLFVEVLGENKEVSARDAIAYIHVRALCSRSRGFMFLRIAGIVSLHVSIRQGDTEVFERLVERVVTDEDDEYSGGWVGEAAYARQVAMKDALRVAVSDFLTALRDSAVEFAAVQTSGQPVSPLHQPTAHDRQPVAVRR